MGCSIRLANVVQVGNCPVEDGSLNDAAPNGADQPAPEHGPRRQLEIVAKLHVWDKGQSLRDGNIAAGFEHHHGRWSPGRHGNQ